MKFLCSSILALTITAAAHAQTPPPPPDGVEQLGDHYACYTTKTPVSIDMVLRDQFGAVRFHADTVSRLCNPVAKTFKNQTTKVKYPTLHYVCYMGESRAVARTVAITNQFGTNRLSVRGPNEVCVPSTKKVIQ